MCGLALLAALAHQGHAVAAQLGLLRDGPVGLGDTGRIPGKRQLVGLVAAGVADGGGVGQLVRPRNGKAVHGVAADEVLHVHRFAGAQQAAVEDGVGDDGPGAIFRRQLEAPGLDALVPARVHEAHVAAGLSRDEKPLPQPPQRAQLGGVVFRQLECARRVVGRNGKLRVDARDAVRIGAAFPEDLACAIHHGHVRSGCRLGLVEGRHPYEGGFAPLLEVHGQVGDQHGRGHVHGLRRIEQRLAQDGAFDLDDVEPGLLQRDPDHLEGTGPQGLGDLEFLDGTIPGEQGRIPLGGGDPAQPGLHLLGPARRDVDDLAGHLAGRAGLHFQHPRFRLGLDVADGHGQRRVGVAFDDAETRRKLGKRRIAGRTDLEREPVGVGQRPARVVLDAGRELELKVGIGGQWPFKCHPAAVLAQGGAPGFPVRPLQHGRAGLPGVERSVEVQAHGQHRDAAGPRVFALAVELGQEGLAGFEREHLVLFGRHPGSGRDALAPHQAHFGFLGEPLPALQQHDTCRGRVRC